MRTNLNKFKYDWGQGQEVPWQRRGSLYGEVPPTCGTFLLATSLAGGKYPLAVLMHTT